MINYFLLSGGFLLAGLLTGYTVLCLGATLSTLLALRAFWKELGKV